MNQKLTIGSVLGETFSLFKKSFLKTILFFIILAIPFIMFFLFYGESLESFDYENYTAIGLFSIGSVVIGLIAATFLFRMLYNIATGKEESISQLLTVGIKKIGPLLGLYILLSLGGVICFLPGIISSVFDSNVLMVLFMIAGYVLVIILVLGFGFSFYFLITQDNIGIIQSIKDSWDLTSNRKWKIFVINLVITIGVTLVFGLLTFLSAGSTKLFGFSEGGTSIAIAISTIISIITYITLYPFFFSFYISQFIVLKRDKGILESGDLTKGFMEEEKDEFTYDW